MSDVAHTKRAACLTPRFASMLRLGTWARQATKAVTRDFDMAPCCVVRVQLGAEHSPLLLGEVYSKQLAHTRVC